IEIIRGSQRIEMAKACLTEGKTDGIRFKSEESRKDAAKLRFTDIQAQAILDLRLAKLIGLEILALKKLHKETVEKIRLYERLLSSETEMKNAIREDLQKIREEFALPRKTVLLDEEETVFEAPKEEARPVVLSISRFGYAKAYDMAVYEKNRDAIDEEAERMIFLMSDSRVLIFTDTGMCHYLKMQDVPNSKMKDKGVPLDNITNYDSQSEQILLMDSYENLKDRILLFATAHAMIKQVQASEFDSVKKTIASTKFADNDRLIAVRIQRGSETVLVTRDHYALRFKTSDISLYKKTSVGVRGLKLEPRDEVTDVYDFDPSEKYVVKIGKKAIDLGKLKLKKRDQKPDLIK
ncbi:MAG: DNA topoisomerase, partial [Lachnospiraceae bacterium]|nr:DNA topoisomerase [Lachnospiraceae bacterium]